MMFSKEHSVEGGGQQQSHYTAWATKGLRFDVQTIWFELSNLACIQNPVGILNEQLFSLQERTQDSSNKQDCRNASQPLTRRQETPSTIGPDYPFTRRLVSPYTSRTIFNKRERTTFKTYGILISHRISNAIRMQ